MVAELLPTKTAGSRPPTNRPPKVTFSPDPDDQDRDMYVYLRDNVRMLLTSIKDVTMDQARRYLELLDQRRHWILEEINIERMMEEAPNPPLGIESDPYDLGELARVQKNYRRDRFEELLSLIDQAQMKLEQRFWEQLWPPNPS